MFRIAFALAAIGLVTGMVFGFLGGFHPAFDAFSHFRWHFALGLLALTILSLVLKIRRAPFILLIFALLGVWQSGAGNRIPSTERQAAAPTAGRQLTLFQYNLLYNNPQMNEVITLIEEIDADLVSLSETSRKWTPKLAALHKSYPHRFHCPEWSYIGGTMLFSKFPLIPDDDYCHAYAALGLTKVDVEGHVFEIGTVHMRWPWPASGPRQLKALEPKLRTIGDDAFIAGDFNAATWSHAVNRFASLAGLNIYRGFGGTWMWEYLPTALAPTFGLPIDNVMAKGSVVITNVQSLPAIGSDHLPLLVKVTLAGK